MKLPTVILVIIFTYLLGFFTHALILKHTVYGDGRYYYSWVRSVVVDHDINFTDEYRHFSIREPNTPRGIPRNKFSIGTAVLWMPAYYITHLFVRGDGWTISYELTVGMMSVLAALSGLILLTQVIRATPVITGTVILLIAGATNLLFYGSLDTVNSHALSFFVATVYLALTASRKKHWLAIGITLGALATIRVQDAVYVLLLLPYWKSIRMPQLVTGCIIGFLPQATAWYMISGSLANPYITGGEQFDFLHPHIIGVLFSPHNGLILWTPVVAIGISGLIRKWKIYWPYLLVFFAELMIISSWGTWWQGASVSGRMFVSTLPIVAIGLKEVIQILYRNRLQRVILPHLIYSLCFLNGMVIIFYLITH